MTKSDLDLIKELDRIDIEASKAQDSAVLLSLWDDDGIALPPGEEPIVGKAALRAWLQGSAEPDYRVTEYVHDFQERKLLGDWAFEWGTYTSAAEPLSEGEPIRATGKLLRILRRQTDGTWKVARAIWNHDPKSSE